MGKLKYWYCSGKYVCVELATFYVFLRVHVMTNCCSISSQLETRMEFSSYTNYMIICMTSCMTTNWLIVLILTSQAIVCCVRTMRDKFVRSSKLSIMKNKGCEWMRKMNNLIWMGRWGTSLSHFFQHHYLYHYYSWNYDDYDFDDDDDYDDDDDENDYDNARS